MPIAGTIILALAQTAPQLVADIIAVLHKQGKITTDEVVAFLDSFPKEGGASFFPSLPKAPNP